MPVYISGSLPLLQDQQITSKLLAAFLKYVKATIDMSLWTYEVQLAWLLCGACLVSQARPSNPRWARPSGYKARESTKAEYTGQYLSFITNGTLVQIWFHEGPHDN